MYVQMAEKAREEVLQRQRAVMNHRHFFLSEDDASQQGEGSEFADAAHQVWATIMSAFVACISDICPVHTSPDARPHTHKLSQAYKHLQTHK
jgi:hypothetical protein